MNVAYKKGMKLQQDIEKKIMNWNERSMFTIKGVKNLSRSDLDSISMYANEYIKSGGTNFGSFMEPRGEIAEVLNKYDIKVS